MSDKAAFVFFYAQLLEGHSGGINAPIQWRDYAPVKWLDIGAD